MSHRMSKLNLNENEDNNSLDVSLMVTYMLMTDMLSMLLTKSVGDKLQMLIDAP